MRGLILGILLIAGCANIVPQTANQALVVSYSQITTLALDAQHACSRELISKEDCSVIKNKLNQALDLMNETSDLVLVGQLLLEVKETIK